MIDALDVGSAKVIAVVVLVALVVIGLVIGFMVQKLMLKFTLLIVVVVLIGVTWWQRAAVADCARTGSCTFFGVDVKAAADQVPR